MRTLYVSVWFYYVPFLALTINFLVPFLAEKFGDFYDDTVAGEMDEAYLEALAASMVENPDFEEPTIPELV